MTECLSRADTVASGVTGWGPVLTYGLVLAGSLLPSASVSAGLGQIQAEWGLSNAESALLYSAYQGGYILAVVLVLPQTDRLDARKVVAAGALTTLAAGLLFPLLSRELFSAVLLRGIAGLGLGALYMPGMRVIARLYSGARLGRAVGMYTAGYYVGNGASLGLTGVFLAVLPWRSAFVGVVLIGSAIAALMLWPVLRGAGWEPVVIARPSLRSTLDLPVLLITLGYCAHSWQLFAVWGWLAPFLADALSGRSDLAPVAVALAGTLSAVLLGLGAVGVYAGGLLSDRLGRTLTAATILGAGALLSLSFGWLRTAPLPLLLPVGLVYGLSVSASSAVYSASLSEIVDPGRLGASLAFQATCGYLAGVAGPIVFGGLLDQVGKPAGWGAAYASAGAAALVGALAMLWLRRLPAATRLAGGRR